MIRTPLKSILLVVIATATLLGGCATEDQRTTTSVTRILDNGLIIITKENRGGDVVSAQAWVADGAVHETAEEAGIASFVARMMFDQTESRGPGEMTNLVENVGGVIKIEPSHDYGQFAITVSAEHGDLALKLLADGLRNATFAPERVERIRRTILSEITSIAERPIDQVNLRFLKEMLGDHPYARPAQGTAATVSRFTPADLEKRHAERYVGNNIVIVVAGAIDAVAVADRVESLFGDLDAGVPAELASPSGGWPTSPVRVVEHGDVHRAYQIVGFPAPAVGDEGDVAMDVLLSVLGLGRSSRLRQALTEKRGLVSGVSAGWYTRRQRSPIFVWMELSPENTTDAELATVALFRDLAESPVDDEEITKAKAFYESSLLFMQETAEGQAGFYGYWTSVGGPDFTDEYVERLAAVTAEDIQELAAAHFASSSHAAVAVVPKWAK